MFLGLLQSRNPSISPSPPRVGRDLDALIRIVSNTSFFAFSCYGLFYGLSQTTAIGEIVFGPASWRGEAATFNCAYITEVFLFVLRGLPCYESFIQDGPVFTASVYVCLLTFSC